MRAARPCTHAAASWKTITARSLNRAVHSTPPLAAADALPAAVAASPTGPSAFTSGVLEPLQGLLVSAQEATGLPWWATLSITAVAVRGCLLPVVYAQAHASSRLALAMPTCNYLHRLLAASLAGLAPGDVMGRAEKVRAFARGARAAMGVHGASPARAVALPLLVQLPAFATCVMATRGLVAAGGHGVDAGGLGWAVRRHLRPQPFRCAAASSGQLCTYCTSRPSGCEAPAPGPRPAASRVPRIPSCRLRAPAAVLSGSRLALRWPR